MNELERTRHRRLARRLRAESTCSRSPGMFGFDEELARNRETGSIAHRLIGNLAATTLHPTLDEVKLAVDEETSQFSPIEARAHRQNLRGLVHQYFWHCLPPAEFMLNAAEKQLDGGRIDLSWFDHEERQLVDEVKAGSPRSLQLSTTASQISRYMTACEAIRGDRFLGIRLISLVEPSASLFFAPGHRPTLLTDTPHIRRP